MAKETDGLPRVGEVSPPVFTTHTRDGTYRDGIYVAGVVEVSSSLNEPAFTAALDSQLTQLRAAMLAKYIELRRPKELCDE